MLKQLALKERHNRPVSALQAWNSWKVNSPVTSIFAGWIAMFGIALMGCTSVAPIRVWKPADAIAVRPNRIAMAPIVGDPQIASKLEEALMGSRTIATQSIAMLDPDTLERTTAVRLTSFQGDVSDIGTLSAARRAESQVLLETEIVHADLEAKEKKKGKKAPPPEAMTIRIRLIDVKSGERAAQHTITVNRDEAEKEYPDLQWKGGSGGDHVIQAMARKTWSQLAPSIHTEEVRLVKAWLTPGARTIHKGNAYAKKGEWNIAEEKWQEVVSAHPKSRAGWHNLAMAAVAKEDFELARRRMDHAKSWTKIVPAEQGEFWIEKRQRDYHASFQLPAPEKGWTIPEAKPIAPESIQPVKKLDIDEMPWWTAIPFTKPPGWTWAQWLSQPIPLF